MICRMCRYTCDTYQSFCEHMKSAHGILVTVEEIIAVRNRDERIQRLREQKKGSHE